MLKIASNLFFAALTGVVSFIMPIPGDYVSAWRQRAADIGKKLSPFRK